MLYPIRINKYLSDKKISSRREADELIVQGKVKINGRTAKLGEMVKETDKVEVEGNSKKLVYVAFNKPKGIITHSPQGDEVGIADILPADLKVFPMGRLDKDSHGLIILSNDGRITDRLLNPAYDHDKEYEVKVDRKINDDFVRQMTLGVKLDGGYVTRKCALNRLDDFSFSLVLTEGKKRQIRRMCTVLGYGVVDLKRVRIMNIHLDNLKAGRYRIIFGKEKESFLSKLGLFTSPETKQR